MKRVILSFVLVLSALSSFSQGSAEAGKRFLDDPFSDPMLPFYLVSVFVFIVLILVVFIAIYLMRVLSLITSGAEKERAKKQGVPYVPKRSWWSRFLQSMNASVAVEDEKSIELEHDYDGIKELDNHLPPWWKWLFYGSIGWAAIYLFVFHISGSLPLQLDEYRTEIALAEEQARKLRAAQPVLEIDENTLTFSPDSTVLIEGGKKVFNDNCSSCHRADGGGNAIGPNLTDEHWLHGGHIKNVFSTIKIGVVEKGMPAWGKALSPRQIRDVAFFIMSLQGTNPENAKGPQGEIYKVRTSESDSTRTQASL